MICDFSQLLVFLPLPVSIMTHILTSNLFTIDNFSCSWSPLTLSAAVIMFMMNSLLISSSPSLTPFCQVFFISSESSREFSWSVRRLYPVVFTPYENMNIFFGGYEIKFHGCLVSLDFKGNNVKKFKHKIICQKYLKLNSLCENSLYLAAKY